MEILVGESFAMIGSEDFTIFCVFGLDRKICIERPFSKSVEQERITQVRV